MRRREFISSTGILISWNVWAAESGGRPKQIYLIRHAEKNGDKADIHLNTRGYQRAAVLMKLFPEKFETPDFLFASRQSAHSNRPVETITPLSKALHMEINERYANESFEALSKDLLTRYPGKTVLVCWHHGNIPAFARALGVTNAPSPWPENQFDRVWRIRFNSNGAAMLENLPQGLLDGDSK